MMTTMVVAHGWWGLLQCLIGLMCKTFKERRPRARTTGRVSSYRYYRLQYLSHPSQALSTYSVPRTCFGHMYEFVLILQAAL